MGRKLDEQGLDILVREINKSVNTKINNIKVINSATDVLMSDGTNVEENISANKTKITELEDELKISENTKYTTENGIKEFSCKNGYVDNVIIEGETLVNLWGTNGFTLTGQAIINNGRLTCTTNSTGRFSNFWDKNLNMLKPNTTYTLVCNIIKNTLPQGSRAIAITQDNGDDPHAFTSNIDINGGETGLFAYTLTTKEDLRACKCSLRSFIDNSTLGNGYEVELWIVLLEGDHTGKTNSYFKGVKSVGQGDSIEVLTEYSPNGNVFDYTKLVNGTCSYGDVGSVAFYSDSNFIVTLKPDVAIPVTSDEVYIRHCGFEIFLAELDSNKTTLRMTKTSDISNIKLLNSTRFIAYNVKRPTNALMSNTDVKNVVISFSKPKYDKKQIATTLRSLPNGVKDTIEKRGNKYYKIQRCGEFVLDNTLAWSNGNQQTNTRAFRCDSIVPLTPKSFSSMYCNLFKDKTDPSEISLDKEFIYSNTSGSGVKFSVRVAGSRLSTFNVEGLKTWLQSNPITVVYELETPIITELPNFNLRTFEGSNTLLINGGVVQGNASFEVTNSLGSGLDVLNGKVSSLDTDIKTIQNNMQKIYYSTSEPTSADGKDGDIWVIYER